MTPITRNAILYSTTLIIQAGTEEGEDDKEVKEKQNDMKRCPNRRFRE